MSIITILKIIATMLSMLMGSIVMSVICSGLYLIVQTIKKLANMIGMKDTIIGLVVVLPFLPAFTLTCAMTLAMSIGIVKLSRKMTTAPHHI